MKTIITEKYDKDGKLIERTVTTEQETPLANPVYPVYPTYPYLPIEQPLITWSAPSTITCTGNIS